MAKILVVDDEAISAFVLAASLSSSGHEVQSASEGTQALEIGQRFEPDILITDWILEGSLSGADVARGLRAKNSLLKVMLITGLPYDQVADQLKSIDVQEIFEKPIDLDKVLATVEKLCASVPA